MGLLDSVLGSVLGGGQQQGGAGALVNIVAGMLANSGQGGGATGGLGGLAGLVEQFQRGGLGDVMNSWIGTGQNLPVAPDQLDDRAMEPVVAPDEVHQGRTVRVTAWEAPPYLVRTSPQILSLYQCFSLFTSYSQSISG